MDLLFYKLFVTIKTWIKIYSQIATSSFLALTLEGWYLRCKKNLKFNYNPNTSLLEIEGFVVLWVSGQKEMRMFVHCVVCEKLVEQEPVNLHEEVSGTCHRCELIPIDNLHASF